MAHNEIGNGTDRTKLRVGNGQHKGRDGNTERVRHDERRKQTDEKDMSVEGRTTRRENGRT